LATSPDAPANNPTRKLAAIMFSDIAGYTATMGRDEAAGLDARNSHRDLLRAILPRFNGRLIGDLGDGALSSFDSAIEAVNCARALQSATGSDRQMALHIGIHVGDVLFSENTVLGDGVNIASRIVALAPAGKICISDRVYEDVRNHRGISATSLGQKHLKNVDRPIGVYILDDSPDTATIAGRPPILSARRKTIIGAAAVGAIVIAVIVLIAMTRRSASVEISAKAPALPQPVNVAKHTINSIAVLPLDNFSGDPNQEYFSDGLTDELTTDLATISALRVTSRGSVMQYKGAHRPPTPEIAKALNVDAVVEGSVARVGDKVRVTAQLIDAPADKHLWAKSYERDSKDVLAMQDEIALAIAHEINVELTPEQQARFTSGRTVNPAAHDAYLKGRYFLGSANSEERIKKAIEQLEEAIKIDPNFALAYAGLADALASAKTSIFRPTR
jgi:TolB-like protein/class 3 adenylate cyclase